MKITKISQYLWRKPSDGLLIVCVETDEGIFGIGDATVRGNLKEVSTAIEQLNNYLIGSNVYDIESWFCRIFTLRLSDGGKIRAAAISGIETACWDIIGKKTGQPLYNLMGGIVNRDVLLCASGWDEGCKTPDDFLKAARNTLTLGFNAIKMKPITVDLSERIALHRILLTEVIENVRAVGNCDSEMYLDLDEKLDFDQALWVAKGLGNLSIGFIQDPLCRLSQDCLRKLSRLVHIPLAIGRSLSGRENFKAIMEASHCSILQPDPVICGGVLETKKIVSLAEAYFMKIFSTDLGSPISLMVSAHISVTVTHTLRNECNVHTLEIARMLFGKSLDIHNGVLLLGNEPGLGLVPDFSKLLPVKPESFLEERQ